MDSQDKYLRRSSSSSAIDLTRTPAGIASSAPPSPSLEPSNSNSRRRTSWGRVDAGQDPLQLDSLPGASITPYYTINDDPFDSPTDDRSFPRVPFANTTQYEAQPEEDYTISYYTNAHAGPSTTSLLDMDGTREDDQARLTTNMSRNPTERWREEYGERDMERTAGTLSPRAKRRTVRYSASPSPLKKTGSALKTVSKSLRRASLRVVNLGNNALENQVRLPDDESEKQEETADDEPLPDLSARLPIRGRTLCLLGPRNKLRLWLYNWLIYPWTEPIILLLIIVNAVVLTVQASHSLTLPDGANVGDALPPHVIGYFHAWEDYVLFVLFVLFTLEAFARICVSGFLFDPEVPASTFFTSPLASTPDISMPSQSTSTNNNLPRQLTLSNNIGGPLSRGLSITERFNRLNRNIKRPFELPNPNNVLSESQNHIPSISQTIPVNTVTEKIKHVTQASHSVLRDPPQPTFFSTVLRSDRKDPQETLSLPFKLSITQSHNKTARSVPYLRQSWGRIDFVAILGFWISFILAMLGLEDGTHHIGVFRALSVIRTARLLTITSGTTTIMHSLKTARPLLANVALFVLFAIILFSVIGIQSFKGSLRRNCFLVPVNGETQQQLSNQFCGGHINKATLLSDPYILLNGSASEYTAKGYICPLGQICQETENPEGNIESFDTIYYAALQIVVTASANSWSGLMYNIIDSEYFVSSLFFIVCVIVLNFWLINLFVAVITNTFSAIRSETQKSAFGAASLPVIEDERDDGWAAIDRNKPVKKNIAKSIYDYTRWCWVLLALASLTLQATRTASVSAMHAQILSFGELGITFAFDLEIVVRLLATLPDWRSFFIRAQNWLDVILAVGSSVIQIPVIKDSTVYPWFTIFQLMRFYRVILEVPRMKPLLLSVFGNMYGLTNMSLFLILVNYLAALVSSQLLRGDMSSNDAVNFSQLYNAFLAVYQVFSSENWTDVLYNAGQAELQLGQTVLVVLFISLWLLFANFIVLQMFIAVINENFDVAEEQKRSQQASHYWSTHQVQVGKATWVRRLNPYRWFKANPVKVKVENLPSSLVLPMQEALVQDYRSGADSHPVHNRASAGTVGAKPGMRHYTTKSLSALQKLFGGDEKVDDVPLATLKHNRNETLGALGDEETERHLELLASVNPETINSSDINDALFERRAQKADFIRDHPTYDKTFWIFSQKDPIRRFCQRLVQPAHGERIFGVPTSHVAHPIFQVVIFLAVIGGIVTEIIATPVYRRNYYATNGRIRGAWFDLTEASFGFVLVLEFIIKIIADGLFFTPNAYIRSIWNGIDFVILSGILVNVTTGFIFIGGLSRFTRSLKALRALRLITLFDRMRNSFQSLIISGASRIFDAALLAILYMIPYAVWGLNIFAGKLNTCNDSNASGMDDCTDEYINTYVNDAFGYPVPRVWDNPAPSTKFSFDNFGDSLLILFEIVSLEGWIDVMQAAASAVGDGLQPQTNASQWNALFFLIYNLLGGVVILTLFVSIIIGNFKSRTGTALLTQPQREWIDLQKLFKRQRPSKRPQRRPASGARAWCFDRAVHKHGWWSRCMTVLFTVHVIILMTQTYTSTTISESMRNDFFLAIIAIYMIDVIVRLYGLGWRSFRANGWNLFDILVTLGSFATTFIARFGNIGFLGQQLQKLFLVLLAFKLVQRSNSLNKLFKTAIASLPSILTLLLLWLILFMFFAILDVEVFGLTKWQSGEDRDRNYSSISSALVMLAFMSTGEGWNQYMHDYALVYPRCSNSSAQDVDSDCGSFGWAFTLFIAWNLLSMYIFVNLFTGVVVDSFSYVFQASGGSKAITREEMRAFKKVWAEFANPQTGYLERSQFVPFFGRLSGVFEVRIYPAQYNIHNIAAACKASPYDNSTTILTNAQPWSSPSSNVVEGLDINKLNNVLDGIDYVAIRKRRAVYNRLYHEATIAHQQGRGISFTDMLLLLAHHKLIKDSEALVLRDLVIRTETNKLVTDLVNLDRVQSLLKMISLRRRFLTHMDKKRAPMYDPDIPAIVVDTTPETPPPLPSPSLSPSRPSSRDISTVGFSGWDNSAPSTPTPVRRTNFGSVQLDFGALGFGGSQFAQQQQQLSSSLPSQDSFSPSHSPNTSLSLPAGAGIGGGGFSSPRRSVVGTGATGLHRSNRRTSDMSQMSRLSTDLGYRYPRDSMGEEDPSLVLEGMQNSIWGDLMAEAMDEEDGKGSG
ncbi:Ion transport protein-domain-containing protein [Lentinula aciculospora]|uniref:Calcium-channel protein CCH1 n=1 Tax=Lentinula aciculospora TaxID=153920 RepID=A0A9W9DQU2_9AGAR|nr:Ion transport protein-domain-containing protein [Lentinula aciculospora]